MIEKEKEKGNSDVESMGTPQAAIEQKYQEIQKKIQALTKAGDFQGIINLLSENSRIIQEYTEIQKKKEEEKQEKIKEIQAKIEGKIQEIQKLKSEIRDLQQEIKKIQGKNIDNSNTRVVNREYHEYTHGFTKLNKAIDIIFHILKKYNVDEITWKEFNKKHSISWHYFIEQVKQGKYPFKANLQELINIDELNSFYEEVKKIQIL